MHYSRLRRTGDPSCVHKGGPKATEGCSVPGCGNKHSGLGLCGPHYHAFRRGRPQTPQDENTLRQCKKCAVEKPLRDFVKKFECFAGRGHVCKKCVSDHNKKRYREDPVKTRENNLKYRNPVVIRTRKLLQKYGLSLKDYDALHAAQKGVCAICKLPEAGKNERLSVDHDHRTNKVRGLLCNSCNVGIGRLKDSIPNLSAAIEYLKLAESDGGTQ